MLSQICYKIEHNLDNTKIKNILDCGAVLNSMLCVLLSKIEHNPNFFECLKNNFFVSFANLSIDCAMYSLGALVVANIVPLNSNVLFNVAMIYVNYCKWVAIKSDSKRKREND